MNDLQKFFPNQVMAKLESMLDIHSWDDFRREFLLGDGKATNTIATYETAARQFYEFTGKLHPMQAGTPERIEQWYDSLISRGVSLDTAYIKIRGLKFLYKKISEKVPFFESPFNIMSKTLHAKLNRTSKDESERDALIRREYQAICRMLKDGDPLDYAIFRFGCTSGLRATELCDLRWQHIQDVDGDLRATFRGKGNKVRTVHLERESVKVCRKAFRERFGRAPKASDYVFNSQQGEGITRPSIHRRIKMIAERAKEAGHMRANLHFSTHVMRHTALTLDVEAGVALDAVQRKAGHSSLSTTQRYLHSKTDWNAVYAKREEVPV